MKRTSVSNRNREQDATRMYLKEVSQNPLLTHAQEIELSQQIEQARKAMIQGLFEIPSAVQNLRSVLTQMTKGDRRMDQAFVGEADADFAPMVQEMIQLIDKLQLTPDDTELSSQVSNTLSELPMSLQFWDELIQPFHMISKQVLNTQGEYLRFAQSKGMSREDFLQNHRNSTPDTKWCKFANLHAEKVQHFESQLKNIAEPTGVTADRLQSLVSEIRSAQRAKDTAVTCMLKSNLRLVVSVAKRYTQVTSTPLLDLIQEGNLGLMRAIEKYNWRLGFRFSTYATWWIKQCVLKAVNEQHRIIRIPSHMMDLAKKVIQAREEYVNTVGYEPSVAEIAQMLEQDETQVARVYTVAQGTISLETPVGQEEDQNLGSLIEDVDALSAFDQIAHQHQQRAISELLSELTPKEERVIRMRFGIGVDQEHTLEDVGNVMGVTRERIRQIEHRALEKLKEPCMSSRMQNVFD